MAKATAAKTKPAAKKPVKQQLKSPKKARNTSASVNKGQISGFLTGIKYKANNPKDPQTSSAQQLLEAYHSQDSDGKHKLIARYMDEGGIKNLAWVASYIESSEQQEQELCENKKGFMTRDEILGLNGFVVNGNLPEKRAEPVLQALLKKCWEANGLADAAAKDPCELIQKDADVPELTMYYYVKTQQRDTNATVKSSKLEQHASLKQSGLKAVLDKATGSCDVKIEFPERIDGKNQGRVLKSGKEKMEKEIGQLKDALCLGKTLNKPEMEGLLKEGEKHQMQAQEFVEQKARKQLSVLASLEKNPDATAEQWLEHTEDMKATCAKAQVHCDGLKAFRARLNVCL
ncbi:unnamed protein product [Symbiodinium natans]|uniref:Uncharacterized protein n=1 Tax=Symbiodinium natans TaxID=878477 RepID=A0A812UWK3_9DINO|nr:unnamed protein product [Symbiodinium natans]